MEEERRLSRSLFNHQEHLTLSRAKEEPRHVRDYLEDAGYKDVLIVRHDLKNIDRMIQEGRGENYDFILNANGNGVQYVAIFEATNPQNAVLQRLYKRLENRAPTKSEIGTNNYDWEGCLSSCEDPSLINKLVIPEWPFPRAYCSKRRTKTTIEARLLEDGHRELGEVPENPCDIWLTYRQLSHLRRYNNLYPDWQAVLETIDGVYCIRDTHSGEVYVGTTWGEHGIWGRWTGYGATLHNHNAELEVHMKSLTPEAVSRVRICLLEYWSKDPGLTQEEATRREALWKEKLGTRRSETGGKGLNRN